MIRLVLVLAVLVPGFFCTPVLSAESNEESTLQIMVKSSVYNVGEKKAIYCEGINVPERIEWISPNNEVVEERSTKDTRIFVKSSPYRPNLVALIIRNTKVMDSGNWTCRSGDLRKVLEIFVGDKPILFDAKTNKPYPVYTYPDASKSYDRIEEVLAVMNRTKEITCRAIANPPPTFNWYKRKNNFDSLIKPNPDVIRTAEDGMSSTLILRMLKEEDIGQYKCAVQNKKGQVAVIFDLTPASPPAEPDNIMPTESNSSHITFNVTCSKCTFILEENQPLDLKNLPIQGYTFQLVPVNQGFLPDWEQSQNFDMDIETADGNETTTLFPVGPLSNNTKFHVRVRSFNAAGHSDWLDIDAEKLPSTTAHAVRVRLG